MTTTSSPRSLFEKILSRHEILRREDGQSLLYVDRHLVQDGSAPAFEMLRQQGLPIRAPQRAFATPDHYVPTSSRELADIDDPEKRAMVNALRNDSAGARSEEHTSELQSLMRISYAVFCLKKKNNNRE